MDPTERRGAEVQVRAHQAHACHHPLGFRHLLISKLRQV